MLGRCWIDRLVFWFSREKEAFETRIDGWDGRKYEYEYSVGGLYDSHEHIKRRIEVDVTVTVGRLTMSLHHFLN